MPSQPDKQSAAAPALDTNNKTELEVAQIVGGARDEREAAKRERRFARSNQRHRYADVVLGTTVYTLSALQHFSGQSNALTLLSMWVAGTSYFMNYALRRLLQPTTTTPKLLKDTSAKSEGTGSYVVPVQQAAPNLSAIASLGTPVERHKVFQLEAVGSWVWMLAAFQQFRTHQRLKWCGYNSWLAVCAAAYYSTRHIFSVMAN